jgi:excisionase family DNA binding protein
MVSGMRASESGSSVRDASAPVAPQREPIAYTLQEVARLLSLSYRKVRYMVDSGEIEVARFGRARRVLRTTLDEYVERVAQEQRRAS